MKPVVVLRITVACSLLVLIAACKRAPQTVVIERSKLTMFAPLPAVMESAANPITEEKVTLGRMLYYENRLSKAQEVSCNTCHLLDQYGVDGHPVSEGHMGKVGDRNAPTVYNAAGQFVQFWDGRAPNVEEQAKGPVMNPVEMAMPSEAYVLGVLRSIPDYGVAFKKAVPADKNPVNFNNMALAIGAFERKLVTPDRWDKFLKGDLSALSNEEKAGFNKFIEVGCPTCHIGPYIGGQMYQKAGLLKPWPNQKDQGRFRVTGQESDKMMFKVPQLRNVERTGPYFHDGSVSALDQAVTMMADYQLGKQLQPEETASIVAWLKTLTGDLPAEFIKEPELPASGPKTPKPDRH